jgi:hypothetical protein
MELRLLNYFDYDLPGEPRGLMPILSPKDLKLSSLKGQIRILERHNRELRSEVARLDHALARSEGANGELG